MRRALCASPACQGGGCTTPNLRSEGPALRRCRAFGARSKPGLKSRPYGRAYSLSGLRPWRYAPFVFVSEGQMTLTGNEIIGSDDHGLRAGFSQGAFSEKFAILRWQARCQSSINHEYCASHKGGIVGCQIERAEGDVIRSTDAAKLSQARKLAFQFRGTFELWPDTFGFDRTGADDVHAHALRPVVSGQ